jgi:muramoyltetrapeptide carboxypeptidase
MEPERWRAARAIFEQRGYELVAGQTLGLRDHRYAGTAQERAADIMALFEDPSIDAIICARGGYGVNRVLPLLDFDRIQAHPKIFIGYSDVTGLLTSFAQRCALTCFHGPMLSSFASPDPDHQVTDYNFDTLERVLSGQDGVRITSPDGCRARILRPGRAQGPLWGGNLSLLNERLGTAGQVTTEGAILFIEEVGEKIHAFDRMLQHLRASGSLDRIAGLFVGELVEMDEGETPFGKTPDEVVLDACDGLDFPIVTHFPCGHGDYQATLPLSHTVELNAEAAEASILLPDSPVS